MCGCKAAFIDHIVTTTLVDNLSNCLVSAKLRDRKGTPKNFCNKDFAELSGELSGAIFLKTLVLMGNDR